MKRPGYYVEGQWFRDRLHQARARAAFLSEEYGRPIDLIHIEHVYDKGVLTLDENVVSTIYNSKKEAVA